MGLQGATPVRLPLGVQRRCLLYDLHIPAEHVLSGLEQLFGMDRSDVLPVHYNGPIISDHSSKNYREHGKIQQESKKETTP